MDFLANIPSWDDIERNLDQTFGELNQSIDKGLQSANDGWDGFTRRLSNGASQVYADHGGAQIDHVRQALTLSYPIVLDDLTRKLASINITEILPVLLKLVREVVMIMGGSVAVGAGIGGAVGSLAFGAGALPGAAVGGSIGLEVGNIILMALGLASLAEYFRQGVGPCASSLSEGFMTAWRAEDGLKPPGLDPTGGSAAMIQERIERAARQFASGQEQYVLLLLTAIVAFLMGRYSLNAMESVATRSFRLRAEITNKEFAEWLARNEQQLLKLQELQPKDVTPLKKAEPEPPPERRGERSAPPKIEMFKKGWTAEDVLAIPQGSRPDPSVYLTPEYMEYHLAQFKNGASRVMPVRNFEKYGIGQTDGTSFIMPHHEVDEIFAKAAGDNRILEQKLGLPEGFLEKDKIVRIDIPSPNELGLRIPSGNEAGANEFWLPGGKLPAGNLEAVIDAGKISGDRLITTPIP
ncbi:hypothetical protein QWI18_21985 [Pseudomonas sp. W2Oct36]|uniref:DUF6861 domain-containing protein n=1 Tax=Pseudomonas sp. W2Oct36 TaxID=1215284 RepID=UPI0034E0B4AE